MVSAVKLNRVRAQAENSRPYVDNMKMIMRALCSSMEGAEHPFFTGREVAKIVLVVITSDRGLCGTFNVNVINEARSFIEEHGEADISIIAVGRKGADALSYMGFNIEKFYPVPWGADIEPELKNISTYLIEAFDLERADAIFLLYSRFVNVLKHDPTAVQYLPIPPLNEEEKRELLKLSPDFIVEPSIEELAQQLTPRYLETQLYHSLVESLASEYAARMVSMRNANDNAQEVIDELNLSYNKARQASITKELIDIIGGVEALNG